MPCRPLRSFPPRISFSLPTGWAADLRANQPFDVRVDDETCEVLHAHIAAFVDGVRIARRRADVKDVQEQLDLVRRRADNVLGAKSPARSLAWQQKLRASLHPLAGAAFLLQVLWDRAAIEWLSFYAKKAREEVARTNAEQREVIGPLVGKLLIDGKPLRFVPDPWREKRRNPESNEKSMFAANMVRCYRWMGGAPEYHKLGTGFGDPEPTHYMCFIRAIRDAVPEPYRPDGDSLLWRSIKWMESERRATWCPAPQKPDEFWPHSCTSAGP